MSRLQPARAWLAVPAGAWLAVPARRSALGAASIGIVVDKVKVRFFAVHYIAWESS